MREQSRRATWLLEESYDAILEAEKTAEVETEVETEEEDAVDVEKALKLVAKIGKHAEKTEDEKLEKLVADLKKALGEEEETEDEEATVKPKKEKADVDFDEL
jgi:hypothetical protein